MTKRLIFLSYSRQDRLTPAVDQFFKRLNIELKSYGVEPFIDRVGVPPGKIWQKELRGAIENSLMFVAFISTDYCASRVCAWEFCTALEFSKNNTEKIPELYCILSQHVDPDNLTIGCRGTFDDEPSDLPAKPVRLGQEFSFLGPNDFESGKLVALNLDDETTREKQFMQLVQKIKKCLEEKLPSTANKAIKSNISRGYKNAAIPMLLNSNIPAPERLIGRGVDIRNVKSALKKNNRVIVHGAPGVGKSCLALEVGNAYANESRTQGNEACFEYVIWVSNAEHYHSEPISLDVVLSAIISVTGKLSFDGLERYDDRGDKEQTVNRLLRQHRTLIIVDNFETIRDPALNGWLLRIPETTRILITSKINLNGIRGQHVELKGLDLTGVKDLVREGNKDPRRPVHPTQRELARDAKILKDYTGGNPKAIEIMLGLKYTLAQGLPEVISKLGAKKRPSNVEKLFDDLFRVSWELLPLQGQRVLLGVPFFTNIQSINREALQAITGIENDADFDDGLAGCVNLFLLEPAPSRMSDSPQRKPRTLTTHPLIRSFAQSKLDTDPLIEKEGRRHSIEYYLSFVENSVRRALPSSTYWNALVSDNMIRIDREWLNVDQATRWALEEEKYHSAFIDFVMLLVHYMDSRCYNHKRLLYVKKAIPLCIRAGRLRDAALLQIDAQSWTLMEIGQTEDARDAIKEGLRLLNAAPAISTEEVEDLRALALTWISRIHLENKERSEAKAAIAQALSSQCRPWIGYRAKMIAGRISLNEGNPDDALRYFEEAKKLADTYEPAGLIEGEAHGYQIVPYMGFAHLARGDVPAAEREFTKLRDSGQIIIGTLFAKCGFAAIAWKNRRNDRAKDLLRKLRGDVEKQGHWGLIKQIDDLLSKID